MKLSEVPARCFQGVSPSLITTCDAAGVPNVTYLSQVFRLEGEQVALSCQFFNKTKRNVLENPMASTVILDPLTFDAYRVSLKYLRDETEGPLFASMSRRIDAIASHTGMAGVFKLRSADVYDVVRVERVEGFRRPDEGPSIEEPPPPFKGEMYALCAVSKRVSAAKDLETLYASSLEALHEALGFEHSMMLLPDETGGRLYAIASRGYGDAGIGAEVGIGDGLVGTAARERCLLRVAGVGAELRYGRAIRTSVQRASGARSLRPEIPLPGLVDAQSQMAIPLVTNERLVAVIAIESRKPAAFEEWHEAFLEIIANQIATAIDAMTLRDRDGEKEDGDEPIAVAPIVSAPLPDCAGKPLRLRFFKSDDCVFSGDEYLVRNVPGRILWKLLTERRATGRSEFSNRELRLDGSLGLPAIRDNLESRLVLLRKRLAQKCPEIRLVPTSRGRFRLEVGCPLELEETS